MGEGGVREDAFSCEGGGGKTAWQRHCGEQNGVFKDFLKSRERGPCLRGGWRIQAMLARVRLFPHPESNGKLFQAVVVEGGCGT